MRLKLILSLAALASLSVCVPAYADGLTGSQVTLTLASPDITTPISVPLTATVAPGIIFPTGSVTSTNPIYTVYNPNISISSDQIVLDYTVNGIFNGSPFNGLIFDFAGAPTITGVTLDALSNIPAGDIVGITFTGDQVAVNLQEDTVTPTTQVLLDVDTASAVTPEPRSILLLATGLLGMLSLVYRKKLAA